MVLCFCHKAPMSPGLHELLQGALAFATVVMRWNVLLAIGPLSGGWSPHGHFGLSILDVGP